MKNIMYIIGILLCLVTCKAANIPDDFRLFQSVRQNQLQVTSLFFHRRPQLTSLDQLKYFPNLKSLRIAMCFDVRHLIQTISHLAPGLQLLSLRLVNFTDLSGLQNLKELEILDMPHFMEDLQPMEKLIDLPIKYLNLSGRSQLKGLEYIQHLSRLERLGLQRVFYNENMNYPSLDFLSPLKRLTHLNLSNGCMIEDISPLANLSSLQSLNLGGVSPFKCTREQSLAVVSKLKNLEYLALGMMYYSQDLSYLSNFPKLKELQANPSCDREMSRLRGYLPSRVEIVKYANFPGWEWCD